MSIKKRNYASCRKLIISIFIAMLTLIAMPVDGHVVIESDRYYTWGVFNDYLNIIPGQIITEVTVYLDGITNLAEDSNSILEFFLVDNPPSKMSQEWVSNIGDIIGDDATNGVMEPRAVGPTIRVTKFEPTLIFLYRDNKIGKENVSFKLSDINNANSPMWKVFKYPFVFTLANSKTVTYSSALLDFIDFSGTSTSVGILIDHGGDNSFKVDGMKIKIKIENYQDEYNFIEQIIVADFGNQPPVIF